MAMRAGPRAALAAEQKHRHVDVAVIGADEVVGAAAKRQIRLSNLQHGLARSVPTIVSQYGDIELAKASRVSDGLDPRDLAVHNSECQCPDQLAPRRENQPDGSVNERRLYELRP